MDQKKQNQERKEGKKETGEERKKERQKERKKERSNLLLKNERKASLALLTPPPAFIFYPAPLATYYSFFSQASSFIWVHFILIDIHRDLCLCTSFLVRIAGGGAAPSPLHPPTRFYFLIGSPCYPLFFLFFIGIIGYFGSLFSFYISLLISIEICACVLLSWYALRGEALRPPPCTPPPAFIY